MNHKQVLQDKLIKFSTNPHWQGKPEKRITEKGIKLFYNDQQVNPGYKWLNQEATPEDLFGLLSEYGYPLAPTLKSDHRIEHNFVSHSVALVDIDDGMTIEQLGQNQFYLDNGYGYYSTPSHKEDDHRFRIVFVLENDITTPLDMCCLYTGLMQTFGEADTSCQDAARLFFGTINATRTGRNNKLLTQSVVDKLIEIGKSKVQVKQSKVSSRASSTVNVDGQIVYEPLNISVEVSNIYLKRCTDILLNSKTGEFHTNRFKAGARAGQYIAGGVLDETEAFKALEDISRQISSNFNDSYGQVEFELTAIKDGIKAGKLKPKGIDKNDVKLNVLVNNQSNIDKNYILPEEASTGIQSITDDFFQGKLTAIIKAIRASAGSGKSTAMQKSVVEFGQGKVIDIYVPTNELAGKQADNLRAMDVKDELNIVHRKGRELTCQRNDAAKAVQAKGMSVFATLCDNGETKCPFYDQCQYIKQFKQGASVNVMPHAWLKQYDKVNIGGFAIDDNFKYQLMQAMDMVVNEKLGLFTALKQITKLDNQQLLTKIETIRAELSNKIEQSTKGGLQEVKKLTTSSVEVEIEEPDLNRLFDETIKPTFIKKTVSSSVDDNFIIEKVKSVKTFNKEYSLINAMFKELSSFPDRDTSNNVRVYGFSDDDKKVYYSVSSSSKNNRFQYYVDNNIPMLIIDADFDENIFKTLAGKPFEVDQFEVKRNAKVIQYFNRTNAMSHFKDFKTGELNYQHLDKVAAQLKAVGGEQTLVVSYMFIEEELKNRLTSNFTVRHFNNIRGLDQYKHFDKICIVGRNQPNAKALEEQASALHANDVDPIIRTGQYSIVDGKHFHADKRVNSLLVQARENETLQAIDRLRFIHNSHVREVHLFCSEPVGVGIDELMNSDDLIVKQTKSETVFNQILRENVGILPLNPKLLLTLYPARFKNIGQCKEAVRVFRNSLKSDEPSKINASRGSTDTCNKNSFITTFFLSSTDRILPTFSTLSMDLVEIEYKPVECLSKFSKHLKALVDVYLTTEQIKTKLEQLHEASIVFKELKGKVIPFTGLSPLASTKTVETKVLYYDELTEKHYTEVEVDEVMEAHQSIMNTSMNKTLKVVEQTETVVEVDEVMELYKSIMKQDKINKYESTYAPMDKSWVSKYVPSRPFMARASTKTYLEYREQFRVLDELELMAAC
jgi:hypothetical protein